MLRVVLIDDEALARRGLRRLLSAHPGVKIVGEAGTVGEAAALVLDQQPDAAFLDIGLPGEAGFPLLHRLPRPLKVVVVTAHSGHAVQAFDVDAVDYLLKPVSAARLAMAVARLEKACLPAPPPSGSCEPVIRLRSANRTLVTPPDRVVAVHAQGDFSQIIIERRSTMLVLQPLKSLERELPAPPFLRLSRSLIVNSQRLREIEFLLGGRARITLYGSPNPLALGRTATARLRAWKAER